ncbi:MAG: Rpn family recombination-promoting nuclease/putative transposase [bacterium]
MSTRDDATSERLKEIIEETFSKETGGVLMTVAEQLIEKGKKEGIEKGKKEGIKKAKIEAAKKMLSKKYPINDIADITGLPVEEIKKLKSSVIN